MKNRSNQRSSHASCDQPHRLLKAEKIIRILEILRPLAGQHVLEIGTGSGVIAAALAEQVGQDGAVTSVDVADQRIVQAGFQFLRIDDAHLPLSTASFDLVISNQVIEHVGDRTAQLTHLREIHRVLRVNGIGYLAAPNRWAILEPHYRLPFLSWLPQLLADTYVRAARKGSLYDCYPPGPLELRRMLRAADLRWETMAGQAVKIMAAIDDGPWLNRVAAQMPAVVIDSLSGLLPTTILILRTAQPTSS
ncbi:class I SAM-dependent methyltransferase [Thiocapsa bogorovii]|uniref:class I SAM-dependent methyltransferase n=1 Tax=Thiocapsa bogorovii TaxID=521689 RepID=UPI001E54C72E|nr:class I SAM-dependent methyltransferase [Thiocapsa bogorovii]UHD16882.1 class I SAM-dependent methyltransferase [Thiocapsa bogorovii]